MTDAQSGDELERMVRAAASASAGAWEISVPSRRAWFSRGLRAMLDLDAPEALHALETFEARIHPEDVDRLRATLERQSREPGPLEVEFRARTRDGRFVWFCATGAGTRAGATGEVQVSGLLQPADLRREPGGDGASTARASFLAAMSHEIRTPMTAVLGFADLLGETASADEATRSAAEAIRRNGEHLLKIVNDILDLSRIEAGAMTLEAIALSPVQLVSDTLASLRPRAAARGLDVTMELLGPVPSLIRTDPTRLRQILMNLVDNAIKFTEHGAVRVGIERGPGESLRFHVTDTGIGIAPEQMDRIFRPFAQGDASMARRFGGTGLGLDISRRLSRMLGGEITLRSTPGRGSTFSVEVSTGPLAGVPMTAALPGAGASTATGLSTRPIRVLLAEDGADNQRLLRHHLEQEGVEVVIAGNGRVATDEAVAARRRGKPFDVVLMDMQMPEMDGIEATRALRDSGFHAAIIALTAHSDCDDHERFKSAGVDAVLAKPIDRAQLLHAVRWHAGRDRGE